MVPVHGGPVQGVPVPGVPVQGVPVPGVPVQGVPVPGVPVRGVPVQGVPVAWVGGTGGGQCPVLSALMSAGSAATIGWSLSILPTLDAPPGEPRSSKNSTFAL